MAKKNDADLDEKTALQKLKNMGKEMYIDVISKESPKFEAPLRSKSNVFYDQNSECLKLGEKKEERKFLSVSQARTFMQTIAIANKTKRFLEEDLHTSIRGLYYQLKFSLGENLDESLFEEQGESNALIEDLEASLGIKREDLHLTTDRKGVLAGPVKIRDKFAGEENIIDGEKQGRSGWMIPSDVDNGMDFVDVKAKYVIVVEKDALWQRLNEDRFWKKEKCVIVTPKGQASRGTRRLIRKLADEGLPVYVFSIDGGEPIIVQDDEGMIKNEFIGEYVDKTMNELGAIKTPFYEKSVAKQHKALEVSEKGTATLGNVLNVVRHEINDKLYEIRTNNGYSVRTTGSHSVMVFDEFKIVPKKVSELKAGHLLLSTCSIPNNEKLKEIELVELIKKEYPELLENIWAEVIRKNKERLKTRKGRFMVKYKDIPKEETKIESIRFGKSELKFKNKMMITKELCRLLGYFVAEGSSTHEIQLTFGAKERWVTDARYCIRKTFGVKPHESKAHPTTIDIKFGGKLLKEIFEKVFKTRKHAKNKRIPSIIFNVPNDMKKEFLKGYFRGDGGVVIRKKGCDMRATTVSRGLASDLVLLLSQLNCYATIKHRKGRKNELDAYMINISNRESLKKLEDIVIGIKPEVKKYIRKRIMKSPLYRSIPVSILKKIQKEIYSYCGKGVWKHKSQKTISLEKVKKLLSEFDGKTRIKRDNIIDYVAKNPGKTAKEISPKTRTTHITAYKTLIRAEKRGEVKGKRQDRKTIWFLKKAGINKENAEKIKIIKEIIDNNIGLIPVKEIKKVKPTGKFVYDIEVNPTHTFVGGVGPLLLHNTDCDAWGWYIYWTIKTGSMNLAYLGRKFATPESKFLGVTMSDIENYPFLKKLTINAKDVDIKRAEEMLGYEWINKHKEWVSELKKVLQTKKKIEQDALQGQRLTFVGEYIKDKIKNEDWLP